MKTKYTALTIGPIYLTFSKARRLKEFWFVSFLFSTIMNRITKQVYDLVGNKKDIILPYIENAADFELEKVGLFPDWLIFKTGSIGFEKFKTFIDNAINETAKELIVEGKISEKDVSTFLKEYLKTYYFEKEVVETNLILNLSPTLHLLELQNPAYEGDQTGILYKIFKYLYKTEFYAKYYRIYTITDRHESMEEISTRELKTILDNGQDGYTKLLRETSFKKEDEEDTNQKVTTTEFMVELQTLLKKKAKQQEENINNQPSLEQNNYSPKDYSFKSYHKYVAIVKADGDKIGKALTNLPDGKEPDFSKALFLWGKESKELINHYQGVPLYIGGDDMLFFAPVVNNGQNIIQLVREINTKFENQFKDFETRPSLSFGISLTYYKYPVFEALENADRLLHKVKDLGGNGISIQLLKHSGSFFDVFMGLDASNTIMNLFDELSKVSKVKSTTISALAFHLRENEKVFESIGFDENRIEAFFENNIEGYSSSKYLKTAAKIVVEKFKLQKTKALSAIYKQTLNEVYDMLRFNKFLKGFDENDR
ncbi:MAG: type III-B CRISPR-associated protein Cas10/Cmr2 [bacterium]|nr:type III-B CRISPR-associated protein Cas10/Cmr2 [bacterium]